MKKQLKELLKLNEPYSKIGKLFGITAPAIQKHVNKLSQKDKEEIKKWRQTRIEKIMEKRLKETIITSIFED